MFYDRKLNRCAICGTRKRLAVQTADNGRLYFLCESHWLLDQAIHRKVADMEESARLKKISKVHNS
jgi:hypothetical protein